MSRRRMMLPSKGILPSGYTQLDYIKSTGQQYIETGVTPTINTKARVKFSPQATNGAGFFGARKDPARFYCVTFNNGSNFAFAMSNNSWSANRHQLIEGNIYDCIAYNGKQIINGIEYNESIISSLSGIGSFALAITYSDGIKQAISAKWYLCQLWENSILIRDLIPCINPSNVVGMYDLVGGQFYQSPNGGAFIAGNPV